MPDYRLHDVPTPLGPLRLTVGALAELTQSLDAPNLVTLSHRIRALGPDRARHLLTALLRPSGAVGQVARLSDQQVADLMPSVSECITRALS